MGDAIILRAGTGPFINNAGSTALATAGSARWLVYSADPASDTVGGLPAAFKQYGAIGTASPLGLGNGLLYSFVPPALNASLQGSVTKSYDGTASASLTGSNFGTLTGLLPGDTGTLGVTVLVGGEDWQVSWAEAACPLGARLRVCTGLQDR